MIAKLLATTALVTMLAGGSTYAASATTMTAPAAASSTLLSTGYTVTTNDAIASKVMGAKVYDGTAENAAQIGTVNDLVFDQNGKIAAAVIGVGGFLGVGQKNVAVDYGQLTWSTNSDGSLRAVLATTKDALNTAPEFNYPQDSKLAMNAPAANSTAVTPAPMATSQTSNSGAITTANDNTAQPEVDPSTLKALDLASMKTDDLKGTDVINTSGQKLGSIGDFVLSKTGNNVDAVIIDFGGFLGIGSKQVALGYDNLKFMTDNNNKHYLEVNVTKDELNAQQAYNKDTYAQDRSQQRMVVNS